LEWQRISFAIEKMDCDRVQILSLSNGSAAYNLSMRRPNCKSQIHVGDYNSTPVIDSKMQLPFVSFHTNFQDMDLRLYASKRPGANVALELLEKILNCISLFNVDCITLSSSCHKFLSVNLPARFGIVGSSHIRPRQLRQDTHSME